MDKPAFKQLHAQLVKRPPVESLRATGGCTLEIHRQVLKGRLRGQRADASTCHAEAFAADSCSDLLVVNVNIKFTNSTNIKVTSLTNVYTPSSDESLSSLVRSFVR